MYRVMIEQTEGVYRVMMDVVDEEIFLEIEIPIKDVVKDAHDLTDIIYEFVRKAHGVDND